MELQLVATLFGKRQTDQPAAMDRHEADDLGRYELGRANEVTLVLAVFVIDNNDHPAVPDLFNCLVYGC
jgi:hypothetical protein